MGPLLFHIYINDFSLTISKILFADNKSIILSNASPDEFKSNISLVLIETINWFQSNLITLNCDKTHFLQFLTKIHNEIKIQIIFSNTIITNINSTKFLRLIIDSTLSWKVHIAGPTSKLNKACYAIRAIKPFMSLDVMKMIYYSHLHSVISYGIIFWGNLYLYLFCIHVVTSCNNGLVEICTSRIQSN